MNIRRFEVLQLVSAFLGFTLTLVDGTLIHNLVSALNSNLVGAAKGHVVGAAIGAAIGYVIGVAVFIALTLLVSRRRRNWARWALLVCQMSGLVFVVWQEQPRAIFSVDYPVATALVWLMQAAALALVFTPQSGRWLKGGESKDLRHAFE